MTILARLLGITSGFALMGYNESPLNLIATSVLVDLALAPLTVVVALRRGRSPWRWTVAGLALGAWALAAVLLLRPVREDAPRPESPPYPPTSDAA